MQIPTIDRLLDCDSLTKLLHCVLWCVNGEHFGIRTYYYDRIMISTKHINRTFLAHLNSNNYSLPYLV